MDGNELYLVVAGGWVDTRITSNVVVCNRVSKMGSYFRFIGVPEMAPNTEKKIRWQRERIFCIVASFLFFFVVFAAEWIFAMGGMG